MPIIYGSLNNASFNELDSSLLLTLGNGLTQSGATYVATPNGIGLATYDNWNGTISGGPSASDIVSYHTSIPTGGIGGTLGIIQYTLQRETARSLPRPAASVPRLSVGTLPGFCWSSSPGTCRERHPTSRQMALF